MSLETTKGRLRRKYLGKGGIHGIGLSRAKQAVQVHLSWDPDRAPAARAILDELRRDAAPYDVFVTIEEMARKLD
jgi:hypothetical protein